MRRWLVSIRGGVSFLPLCPSAIGVGLAVLMAAVLWPGVPALTAFALVALGATSAMLNRFRGSASLLPMMLAHLVAYGGLYSLFVGAALHATAQHQPPQHSTLMLADLVLSFCPLLVALKLVWCELGFGSTTE